MPTPLTVNGQIFNYPQNFDTEWGVDATGWAQAVTSGMLQKAGGSFTLTADVDFGASFGLKSSYFETRSISPATSGTVRLSSADTGIAFRNNANNANLVLTTNSSDNLLYNGQVVALSGSGSGSSPMFINVTLSNSLILDDTEVSPKTLTIQAPSILSTSWDLRLPINSGLNGQVLQTDGAGNTSWVNAAGGGTVNSGTAGNFAYYATSSNVVSDSGVNFTAPVFTGVATGLVLRATQSTNQLSFTGGGGGNQIRVVSVAPTTTVGEVITIPDIGASANVILDQGTQTINGSKTFSAALSMGSNQINNVSDPSSAQDVATKNYVDTLESAVESVVNVVHAAASGFFYDITSITLTAGRWLLTGCFDAVPSSNTTNVEIGISTTVGNSSTGLTRGSNHFITSSATAVPPEFQMVVPSFYQVVGSTTTYYLKGNMTYSSGSPFTQGARLTAIKIGN